MIQIYEYAKCDTCRKALRYLEANEIAYKKLAIVDTPPSIAELKKMLGHLKADGKSVKNLFNTSGEQYRALKIGDRIKAGMTETEALELLSKNGKLIKRPFALSSNNGTVGFDEKQWKALFLTRAAR